MSSPGGKWGGASESFDDLRILLGFSAPSGDSGVSGEGGSETVGGGEVVEDAKRLFKRVLLRKAVCSFRGRPGRGERAVE
jgi:hypothetical protein